MRYLTILDEDFNNYKKPAMFIGTISCGGKCCIEAGIPLCVCQNDTWRDKKPISSSDDEIIERYLSNKLTSAIVFGGLEPFEQWEELFEFVKCLRIDHHCSDDIVIYTGYNFDEIKYQVLTLKQFENIIIKFGRYLPDQDSHFDEVLGVSLASNNQYGEKIS